MPDPSREALVAAARGWIGTPFHHQAAVKGVGCDCIGLVRGVAAEVGLSQGTVDAARYQGYSRAPDPRMLLRGLMESLMRLEGGLTAAMPGDILLFRIDKDPQHLAFKTDVGMIHALAAKRRVIEHGIDDYWRRRFVSAWCLLEFTIRGRHYE